MKTGNLKRRGEVGGGSGKTQRDAPHRSGEGARPVIARLWHLAGLLRAGKRFTANTVAAELEVDPKTVRRDLGFLSDRLRYDIEWDGRACTYRLLQAPEAKL